MTTQISEFGYHGMNSWAGLCWTPWMGRPYHSQDLPWTTWSPSPGPRPGPRPSPPSLRFKRFGGKFRLHFFRFHRSRISIPTSDGDGNGGGGSWPRQGWIPARIRRRLWLPRRAQVRRSDSSFRVQSLGWSRPRSLLLRTFSFLSSLPLFRFVQFSCSRWEW